MGDLSVNGEMVRRGFALAYLDQSDEYVPQEDEAKAAKAGLWQDGVEFQKPWVWRKTKRRAVSLGDPLLGPALETGEGDIAVGEVVDTGFGHELGWGALTDYAAAVVKQ